MKKTYVGMLVTLVTVAMLSLTSCQISTATVKIIANAVGLFSSVSWIAIDNPAIEVKQGVITVVEVIKEKASLVEAGQTYSDVLYPELVKVIDVSVPAQYRPLCKAGALMMLGQLDLLFASHPEWKTNQDIALAVTESFCDGVKQGLSLAANDPIIVQAQKNAIMRSNLAKSVTK